MTAVLEALVPAVLIAAYMKRVATLRRLGREPSLGRQVCFVTGMLLLALTQVTPLGELSRELVSAHMLAHTLITDETALLLALGLTGPVLGPLLGVPVLRQLVHLFNPAAVLVLWAVLIGFWHLPGPYEAAAENPLLHIVQHGSFLFAGLGLWLTVFGPFPQPRWFNAGARIGLVVVVHLFNMALSNALMFSGSPFYESYAATAAARGVDPLTDQGIAGGILMAQGFVVMLGVLAWELLRWAREETARQELLDFARERGVELDEERARRAARSGSAQKLRERIEAQAARRPVGDSGVRGET
jgi:cytochrome c oxidase assembly factor CtaG